MSDAEQLRESLPGRVAAAIDAHGLLAPGQSVVLAVSGGADSVALLRLMHELARCDGRGYRLAVAHLDHALRDNSAAEARWVRELAESLQLPVFCRRQDVAAEAHSRRVGIEQAARDLRRSFYAQAAGALSAQAVATAHHADDQAETVLFRAARGSHLQGLAGIAPRQAMGENAPVLIRPLLGIGRQMLREYLRAIGQGWQEDPTNAELHLARNRIRHVVLPQLAEAVNPNVVEALGRLAAAAAESEAYLAGQAQSLLADAAANGPGRAELDLATLAGRPDVLLRCAFRRWLVEAGVPGGALTRGHLEALAALAEAGEGVVNLPADSRVRARAGRLRLLPPGADDPPAPADWSGVALNRQGETRLPDGRVILCRQTACDTKTLAAHRADPRRQGEYLDADRLEGPLTARPVRPGDAFVPLGAPGHQKVSDFLINAKVPAPRRAGAVCVCDRLGIVYLAPYRIADRVAIRPGTTRTLFIEMIPV